MQKISQCSINITRACNLRCYFCYAKRAGYDPNAFINFEVLKKLINFCNDLEVKYIILLGGEPLLYPYLAETLSYIKEQSHKIETAVPTNGLRFSNIEYCKKIIESGLDYVDISMKGKDSGEWLKFSGFDGFVKQMLAIKNLSQFLSSRFTFTCSMVITDENVNTFCETVKHASEAGGHQFSFTFVIDNNDFSNSGKKYLEQHNPLKLIERFVSQIERLDEITNGEWWVEYSFPNCVYSDEQLFRLKGRLASPCNIHYGNGIEFDENMNLIPCGMFVNETFGKFGKDFSIVSEFWEYFNGKKVKKVLSPLQKLPSERCHDCMEKESCLGGCPWFWRHCSFDEFMDFKKEWYMRVI